MIGAFIVILREANGPVYDPLPVPVLHHRVERPVERALRARLVAREDRAAPALS